jgi:hypothetical protein
VYDSARGRSARQGRLLTEIRLVISFALLLHKLHAFSPVPRRRLQLQFLGKAKSPLFMRPDAALKHRHRSATTIPSHKSMNTTITI